MAFLGLLGFVAAFVGARTFTTFFPETVVVSGGIHFHHFWYGLVMVFAAGWLGIGDVRPAYNRAYALVFGLGWGLIGDEVGLLLTFGNYRSQLTYFFVVGAVSFALLVIFLFRYRDELEDDVLSLGRGERLAHVGVAVAAFSALFFAAGFLAEGLAVAAVGFALATAGVLLHVRKAASLSR